MPKQISLSLLFLLLLVPLAAAQGNANPTIALLSFGSYDSNVPLEMGLLDTLQVYEWISAEERALLNAGQDIEGDRINIIRGSANFDLPTVNIMVEDALDRGADILVTAGAAVTQTALNLTLDAEEPPSVLFHSIYSATHFGIIDAPCLKPAHITGSEYTPPYEEAVGVFLAQNPDLARIGTLHTSTDAGGIHGAERIGAIAAARGINVESAAIASLSDLRAATQGLVNKDVEAIMLPIDFTIGAGLPIVVTVAKENQIPVFYPIPGTVLSGVTIGAGFNDYYNQGNHTALLLDARLNGSLDIETTAVASLTGVSVGINVDIASEMGIEIPQDLQDAADITVRDGAVKLSQRFLSDQLDDFGAPEEMKQMVLAIADTMDWRPLFQPGEMSGDNPMMDQFAMMIEFRKSPAHKAADAATLASLQCTDELIAEQQAALDAESE